MSLLHTMNKSPFQHGTLRDCLTLCSPGDALLLLEDGAYAALASSPCREALQHQINDGLSCYVLSADLNARIHKQTLIEGIELASDADFVDLVLQHSSTQSWY